MTMPVSPPQTWECVSLSKPLGCAPRRGRARAALTALGAAACLAWLPAVADKADRQQPLNFSADSARVDDSQKLNVLTGRVEITKGTMVFRAARVEVRQNPDGSQTAQAWGAPGGRAYFRQKREGLNEYIEGEGDRIEYNGRADTVRFSGHAVMRRLRGATLADEVAGQTVLYDNKTEVFQVVGGAESGTSPGRVRGVIAPRLDPHAASSEDPR